MNNLQKYRKSKGFSQTRLAKAIGLNGRGYIGQCEQGTSRLSLESAKKIANVLGVDPYDLLGDDLLYVNPTSQEDKSKIMLALTKSDASSFVDAFSALIDSYMYLLMREEGEDAILYGALHRIKENLGGFSTDDLRDLYVMISRFIDSRGIATRNALSEFESELINRGNK